jgi:lysophospholipase L1-like esterase
MTTIGQSGLDLYVDGRFIGSAWPNKEAKIRANWRLSETRQMHDVTIYLPLYKPITISEIILDADAKIEAPSKFALPKPVVYYGSSITQGGCAENPGLSYQSIVSRWLNLDHVNLGFSGNGLGEPAVAQAIAEIDAAVYVLDYWGNPSAEVYSSTMPVFVDILRAKYPKTPILITGAYYFSNECVDRGRAATQDAKRKIARDFVAERNKAGDKNIIFVDGREMLSPDQAEGLVDGVHANSLGFYFCAKGLEPYLRKVLDLPGGNTKH